MYLLTRADCTLYLRVLYYKRRIIFDVHVADSLHSTFQKRLSAIYIYTTQNLNHTFNGQYENSTEANRYRTQPQHNNQNTTTATTTTTTTTTTQPQQNRTEQQQHHISSISTSLLLEPDTTSSVVLSVSLKTVGCLCVRTVS